MNMYVHLQNNKEAKKVVEKLRKHDSDLKVVEYETMITVDSKKIGYWVSYSYTRKCWEVHFTSDHDSYFGSYPLDTIVNTLF